MRSLCSKARRSPRRDIIASSILPDVTERPILVCYDGSGDARRALEAAAALFAVRDVVVLDVAPLRVSQGYSPVPSDAPFVDESGATDALGRAETGAELARKLGFDSVARSDTAIATWRGVTEVADEVDASVIVVGSRGLSGLRELAHRSLSLDVARHARRPVLIVPPSVTRRD